MVLKTRVEQAQAKKVAPGPTRGRVLWQMPGFILNPYKFLTRCHQAYGDVVSIQLPMLGPVYLVNHPDYIEHILVSNPRDFVRPRFYQSLRPVLGNGLALSEGELWLRQRRMMQPSFHRERINTYTSIMVEQIEHMLNSWQADQVRSIDEDMTQLALAIVTKALLGADLAVKAQEVSQDFKVLMAEFGARVTNPLHLPESIPTPHNLRYRHARAHLDQVIFEIIKQRKAELKQVGKSSDGDIAKKDMLSSYLQAQDEDGSSMSDQQLRDEAITVMLGGHESTASTMSWAWYLLAKHPQVEARLHSELDRVLGGRIPTVDDLHDLPYTGLIIKEVLRLYPVLWFLQRQTIDDFQLGDYLVPAGTTLMFSPWITQRDPRFFSEPDEFRPERWEDPQVVKHLPKFAYFPFGGGPRQCIGNSFGLLESTLVLAIVAQRYRLRLEPGAGTIKPAARMTLRSQKSIKLVLSERKPATV